MSKYRCIVSPSLSGGNYAHTDVDYHYSVVPYRNTAIIHELCHLFTTEIAEQWYNENAEFKKMCDDTAAMKKLAWYGTGWTYAIEYLADAYDILYNFQHGKDLNKLLAWKKNSHVNNSYPYIEEIYNMILELEKNDTLTKNFEYEEQFDLNEYTRKFENVESTVADYIMSLDSENKYKTAYNLILAIQKGLFGCEWAENDSLEEINRIIKDKNFPFAHSSVTNDYGISALSFMENQQYSFLMLKPEDNYEKMILPTEEYKKLFADLSDIDYLNALFLLYRREENEEFDNGLFIKNLNIPEEKSQEIIHILLKYKIIKLNEAGKYNFYSSHSFIPFFLYAREMIIKPNLFWWHSGNNYGLN
jgi:hypothetical protein